MRRKTYLPPLVANSYALLLNTRGKESATERCAQTLGTSSTYRKQRKMSTSTDVRKHLSYSWKSAWWNSGTFNLSVRDVLSNTCHDRRIRVCRGGPTTWPPRSPDLNPLDFYPWGHLATPCMQLLLITKEHISLWMPVRVSIRNYPSISQRMWRSMLRRAEACIQSHGSYFEHSL
jgi:hypothetical protein